MSSAAFRSARSSSSVPIIAGTGSPRLAGDPAFMHRPKLSVLSIREIWGLAALTGGAVFLLALTLQWVIYDRMLHQDGIRIVGSAISAGFAVLLVYSMNIRARNARLAELRRLETIALMNHHIRNSLQTIMLCSATSDDAAIIRLAIDRIEWTLSDVLPGIDAGRN